MGAAPNRKTLNIWRPLRRALGWFVRYPIHFMIIALPGAIFSIGVSFAYAQHVALGLLGSLGDLFFSEIVNAAIVWAAYSASRAERPSILGGYARVLGRTLSIFEYFIRYVGAVLLIAITIVGLPFAVGVAVRWWFGPQAIVIHDESAKGAITRSSGLVNGVGWSVFLAFLLTNVVTLPFVFFASARSWEGYAILSGLGLLETVVIAAYGTALYLQLEEQEATRRPQEPLPEPPTGWVRSEGQ